MQNPARMGRFPALALQYPLSLGVFEKYDDAQRAVDTLSDKSFPVQNVLIVGTDLRQMERVTGRITRARAALGGLLSGIWLGLFVGFIFSLFDNTATPLVIIGSTVVYGAIFGLVWALIGYQLTGGHRDFTSVTQVVATKYEVLCEHKFAEQARQILRDAGLIQPVWAPPPPSGPPSSPEAPTTPSQPPTPPVG